MFAFSQLLAAFGEMRNGNCLRNNETNHNLIGSTRSLQLPWLYSCSIYTKYVKIYATYGTTWHLMPWHGKTAVCYVGEVHKKNETKIKTSTQVIKIKLFLYGMRTAVDAWEAYFAKTSASWHSFPDSPTRVHKSIMANSINSIQIQNTKLKFCPSNVLSIALYSFTYLYTYLNIYIVYIWR